MSLNYELSNLFAAMADIMDIKGENAFKVLAFRKVSRIIKDLAIDIHSAVTENTIGDIEGIGEHSRRIIVEYVTTGRSTDYDQLAQSVPTGLLPLLHVEGLGPKTISLFWKERSITNADQLKAALENGSLTGLRGIGEKKLAAIKQGLEAHARAAGRVGLAEALPVAEDMVQRLAQLSGVLRAEIAGSLRRRRETIGDVDLLCSVKDASLGQQITEAFANFPSVARVLNQGPVKASVVSASGLQVDLRVLAEPHFGAALLYFTGSKEHNVKIRGLAQRQHLTLNEWGLYKLDDYEKAGKKTSEAPPIPPIASKTEEEIYKKLAMEFVPPELREDRGEVEAAQEHSLPKLITRADLHGDLHCHTTASDGAATIEAMAEAAKALGYQYLAITDHSQSQAIANGLTPQRLLKHIDAIRKIASKLKGITLLAGSEVDILADGRLDYEDAVLAELDIVIASPHFALKQDQLKATDRLLRAIENPYVNVIGHPTGRLINAREGLPLDFPRIYQAAATTGTALEINAGWPRLDLDEFHARAAIDAGVMLSIDTDAHSTQGLSDIDLGLSTARRGWVTAKNVLNCLKLPDLRKFLARKR
ncbi:MAG TPA: DNA polymerase/3'-5' exonuclease PolX [Tepidisphaeraceae bacterium]|nr:DNA polymerase/3'-5' exonuclease PolX [Tepidisphaeraceae bacterium]